MPDTSNCKGGRSYFDLSFQRFHFCGHLAVCIQTRGERKHHCVRACHSKVIYVMVVRRPPWSGKDQVTRNTFPEQTPTLLLHPSRPHFLLPTTPIMLQYYKPTKGLTNVLIGWLTLENCLFPEVHLLEPKHSVHEPMVHIICHVDSYVQVW